MPRRLAHFSDPRLDAQVGELIKKHKELQAMVKQQEKQLRQTLGLPPHDHSVSDITDFPSEMTPIAHDHGVADITDFPSEMPPTAHAASHESGDDKLTNLATGLTVGGNTVWHAGNLDPGSFSIVKMAAGSYVGDGVTDRPISVGFQPKLVISAAVGQADLITSLSTSGGYTANTSWEPRLALTTSGFTVGSGPNRNGNKADVTYTWVAFA
jgi:hypothetical protein